MSELEDGVLMYHTACIGDSNVKIPLPPAWSHLNEMMNGGMEKGEITVLGALTSIGKSTVVNNIVYHLIENTRFNKL